jgi:hypothetical protein
MAVDKEYRKYMKKKRAELEKEICRDHPYNDNCTCGDCDTLFTKLLFAGLDYR